MKMITMNPFNAVAVQVQSNMESIAFVMTFVMHE